MLSYCYDLPGITADGRVGAPFSYPSGIRIPGFGKKNTENREPTYRVEVDVIDVRPKIQFATMYDDKIAVP
jgi:hypothetical protein